jgi:hypothetical protein
MSLFENISVDFSSDGLLGKSRRTVGNRKVWRPTGVVDGFSSKAPEFPPLALLGVSLARESPSCCDWLRRIQDSQPRTVVTDLRERFYGGREAL